MSTMDWVSLATCIATLLSILALIWQVMEAKKALNTNTCCSLFEFWMSKEMEDKRWLCKEKLIRPRKEGKWEWADFQETLDQIERESGKDTRDEINKALWEIFDFFEHMGVLVKHGGLDIKVVLEYWDLENIEEANFMKGSGCFNCMDKGYKGRTGVYEVLIIDETIQDMILNRKSSQDISRAARQAGKLTTLKEDAAKKVTKGITTLEEAASAIIV